MCGRYVLATPAETLADRYQLSAVAQTAPRYNIAPSQSIPVIQQMTGQRQLVLLQWGLVPRFFSTQGRSTPARSRTRPEGWINARAETVFAKPAFREAARRRRCLIPADGFYEWRVQGKQKEPYYFSRADHAPFVMAGLWEPPLPGAEQPTVAILTTEANALIAPLHQRMPVMLPDDAISLWLAEDPADNAQLAPLLVPFPAEQMNAHPVSRHVNSPKNDDPSCIVPVADAPARA